MKEVSAESAANVTAGSARQGARAREREEGSQRRRQKKEREMRIRKGETRGEERERK
jgi:hypothetical protein